MTRGLGRVLAGPAALALLALVAAHERAGAATSVVGTVRGAEPTVKETPAKPTAGGGKERRHREVHFGGKKKPDHGSLHVVYEPAKGELGAIRATLVESQVFDELVKAVDETFALPADLGVAFRSCGEENAFYSPDEKRISLCYELVAGIARAFSDDEVDDEEKAVKVAQATIFVFLHELGHALVDLFDLPITGKEEDAVDDLAAILLLADDEEESAVVAALDHFWAQAEKAEDELDDIPYWDEHSLDAQRYYSIACLLYGSDPESHASLVEDGDIPPERAERCPAEYERKFHAWETLLGPYVKE